MKSNPTTFPLAQAAELIQIPGGVEELINWLHSHKYITNELLPRQSAIDSRLLFGEDILLPNKSINTQLHITIKGLGYFSKKINHSNFLASNWKSRTELD